MTQPDAAPATSNDEHAVMASVLYSKGAEAQAVPLDAIEHYRPEPGRLLWIGLKEPPAELLTNLCERLGFGRKAIEEIIEPHRRAKIIEYANVTLVVAITVEIVANMHPMFGETQLLIGKGVLVTVRRGATATHTQLRERLENSPELLERGSDFVASEILDLLVDRYVVAATALEKIVETAEQKLLLRGFRDADVKTLYRQRRDLLRIHVAISPLVEICRRMSRVELNCIDANSRGYFGEVADRVQRIDELVNSLREALAFAFEASLMIGQSQQTDVAKKLAAWAAILAVPTAVAGNYGMNFHDMPELAWPHGYPIVMGITALFCVILYWRFRKSGWL